MSAVTEVLTGPQRGQLTQTKKSSLLLPSPYLYINIFVCVCTYINVSFTSPLAAFPSASPIWKIFGQEGREIERNREVVRGSQNDASRYIE